MSYMTIKYYLILSLLYSRHVFPWKTSAVEVNLSNSVWKIFSKPTSDSTCSSPIHTVASSSALIQNDRYYYSILNIYILLMNI